LAKSQEERTLPNFDYGKLATRGIPEPCQLKKIFWSFDFLLIGRFLLYFSMIFGENCFGQTGGLASGRGALRGRVRILALPRATAKKNAPRVLKF